MADEGESKEEFEMLASGEGENEEDNLFDEIVGVLEGILMSDEFQTLQSAFFAKHSGHFEATDENKLIYTEIFNSYTDEIETYVEQQLTEEIPGFSMSKFAGMLADREGDVFDTLMSFTEFEEFKELMLSHKAEGQIELVGSGFNGGISGGMADLSIGGGGEAKSAS